MKKFIINIISFSSLLIILSVCLDVIVSEGSKKCNSNHPETFNVILNDTINADVLILGNSRAACSYNPGIIDSICGVNSYNLGIPAQPFAFSELRYRIYRRHNKAPKLIIVNIDNLEMDVLLGSAMKLYYPYIIDQELHPLLLENGCSWLDLHCPLYRYRGDYKFMATGIVAFFKEPENENRYKGYYNCNEPWDGVFLTKIIKENDFVYCEMHPTAVEIMDGFIKKAQEENVKVVFSYAPQHVLVQENMPPKMDTVMAIYKSFATKYNVPIFDSRDWSICQDTSYFYNGMHCNIAGSRIFSEELAKSIKPFLK